MRKPPRPKSQKQWLAATKAAFEFQFPHKETTDDARSRQKTGQEVPGGAPDAEGSASHKNP